MAFSPDSKKLVTSSTDKKVRLWNIPEKKVVEYLPEEGHGISGLAFAPDGNTVASSGSHIELWDVTKNRPGDTQACQPKVITPYMDWCSGTKR